MRPLTIADVPMPERHDTILPALTDDALTADLAGGGFYSPERAAQLLTVPPEYRQGVEIAVNAVTFHVELPSGRIVLFGVDFDDAYRAAIGRLAAAGIPIQATPTTPTNQER